MKMVALLALWPGFVMADGWTQLEGSMIADALTARGVVYDTATQHFYASGRTLYNAGQESWGYWAVRGDQYCSQWPPSDQWDCYDVAQSPGMIRFIGADGSTTDGRWAE